MAKVKTNLDISRRIQITIYLQSNYTNNNNSTNATSLSITSPSHDNNHLPILPKPVKHQGAKRQPPQPQLITTSYSAVYPFSQQHQPNVTTTSILTTPIQIQPKCQDNLHNHQNVLLFYNKSHPQTF